MDKKTADIRLALAKRAVEDGASMTDRELLSGLLCFTYQEDKADMLSERLLLLHRTAAAVFSAPVKQLCREGLTENAALLLHTVVRLSSFTALEQGGQGLMLDTAFSAAQYLVRLYAALSIERVYMLMLDRDMRLTDTVLLSDGSVNSAAFQNRSVVECAIEHDASYAILAHNHPGGRAVPSETDVRTTASLQAAFDVMGIPLVEHFLVAGMECVPLILTSPELSVLLPSSYYTKQMLAAADKIRSTKWAQTIQEIRSR